VAKLPDVIVREWTRRAIARVEESVNVLLTADRHDRERHDALRGGQGTALEGDARIGLDIVGRERLAREQDEPARAVPGPNGLASPVEPGAGAEANRHWAVVAVPEGDGREVAGTQITRARDDPLEDGVEIE
jgi:hypothetical protein